MFLLRLVRAFSLVWALIVGALGLTGLYGLFLAFSANVWLGIICVFVQPLPLIIGLCNLFGHPEIIPKLINFIQSFVNIV